MSTRAHPGRRATASILILLALTAAFPAASGATPPPQVLAENTPLTRSGDVHDYVLDVPAGSFGVIGLRVPAANEEVAARVLVWDNPTQAGNPLVSTQCGGRTSRSLPHDASVKLAVVRTSEAEGAFKYYPRVARCGSSTPSYVIEAEAKSVRSLEIDATAPGSLGANTLFDAYEIRLEAGTTYNVSLRPAPGNAGGFGLLVLEGTAVTDANAFARSASTTTHAVQHVALTPARSATHLVVVTNAGGGAYVLEARADFLREDSPRVVHQHEALDAAGRDAYAVSGAYALPVPAGGYSVLAARVLPDWREEGVRLHAWDDPAHKGPVLAATDCSGRTQVRAAPNDRAVLLVASGIGLAEDSTRYVRASRCGGSGILEYVLEHEGAATVGRFNADTRVEGQLRATELFDAHVVRLEEGITYTLSLETPVGAHFGLGLAHGEGVFTDAALLAHAASTTAQATQRAVVTPSRGGDYLVFVLNHNFASGAYNLSVRPDFADADEPFRVSQPVFASTGRDAVAAVGSYAVPLPGEGFAVVAARIAPGTRDAGVRFTAWDNPAHVGPPLAATACAGQRALREPANDRAVLLVVDASAARGASHAFLRGDRCLGDSVPYVLEHELARRLDGDLTEGARVEGALRAGELFDAFEIDLEAGRTYVFELETPLQAHWGLAVVAGGAARSERDFLAHAASTTAQATQVLHVTPVKSGAHALLVLNHNGASGEYVLAAKPNPPPADAALRIHLGEHLGAGRVAIATTGAYALPFDESGFTVVGARLPADSPRDFNVKVVARSGTGGDVLASTSCTGKRAAGSVGNERVAILAVIGSGSGSNAHVAVERCHATGTALDLEWERPVTRGNLSMEHATAGTIRSGDLFDAHQARLRAGVPYTFELTPSPGARFGILILDSANPLAEKPVAIKMPERPGEAFSIEFTPTRSGPHLLLVTNEDGVQGEYEIAAVRGVSTIPFSFTADVTNLVVEVSADVDDDLDEKTSTFAWDWGDDSGVTQGNPSRHLYVEGGTYTVTLTMTKADGNVQRVSKAVAVREAGAPAPEMPGGSSYMGPDLDVDTGFTVPASAAFGVIAAHGVAAWLLGRRRFA